MRLCVSMEPGNCARNTCHVSEPSCHGSASSTCTPSSARRKGVVKYVQSASLLKRRDEEHRTHLRAGERIPRCMSFRNQCTVQFFNGDSVRRGHRTLIRLTIRTYRRAYFVQPGGHTARSCIRYHSFQRKE